MKGENPFTLTFGQKPVEFISRTDQIGKIINTFDMENPSNRIAFKCRYGSDFRGGIGIKPNSEDPGDRFGN